MEDEFGHSRRKSGKNKDGSFMRIRPKYHGNAQALKKVDGISWLNYSDVGQRTWLEADLSVKRLIGQNRAPSEEIADGSWTIADRQ